VREWIEAASDRSSGYRHATDTITFIAGNRKTVADYRLVMPMVHGNKGVGIS